MVLNKWIKLHLHKAYVQRIVVVYSILVREKGMSASIVIHVVASPRRFACTSFSRRLVEWHVIAFECFDSA